MGNVVVLVGNTVSLGSTSNITQGVCCVFNPLNAELNSICHLLALLGAHPILHVSRIRVNMVTRLEQLSKEEVPVAIFLFFLHARHALQLRFVVG
jgi:hypothetical protein